MSVTVLPVKSNSGAALHGAETGTSIDAKNAAHIIDLALFPMADSIFGVELDNTNLGVEEPSIAAAPRKRTDAVIVTANVG